MEVKNEENSSLVNAGVLASISISQQLYIFSGFLSIPEKSYSRMGPQS